MDLDAYVRAHGAEWQRLEALAHKHKLTGQESDELVERYQHVSTHLSMLRSHAPDPGLIAHLSAVLLHARTRLAGSRVTTWAGVRHFFTRRFPAALYLTRHWWLATVAVNVVVAGVLIWWLVEHPGVEQSLLTTQQVDQLVNEDFEGYYSEYAPSQFATLVWVNNAWVAAQALAFGTLGFPVVYVLYVNTLNLAVIGSIMISHGRGGHFWGLILPHGLLELTAVYVAAGVGLRLFWAWIVPGDRSRAQALGSAGRTAGTVALGLIAVLAVSGLIEGFVTPSGLPTWGRVGIGVIAEFVFLVYVFGLGRRAVSDGETGDIDQFLREVVVPAKA
jgi:uncharacterized membrane protein SpoIIM required for sporulation